MAGCNKGAKTGFSVLCVRRYILRADDRYQGANPLTALYGEVKP